MQLSFALSVGWEVFPNLPPTTYHLPPFFSTTFPLYARISFVINNIPAFYRGIRGRSFVFNDIPASLVQKLKLLRLSSP